MKKIAYITPEMEILELKQSNALLSTSDGTQIPHGGTYKFITNRVVTFFCICTLIVATSLSEKTSESVWLMPL